MSWRPIAEVPPDVDTILAFDPDNWSESGPHLLDDRISVVTRHEGGWWFQHHQGGYLIRPTLFRQIALPDGLPADPRCS